MSFNFMAGVTAHRDFVAQENKISLLPLFHILFAMNWWDLRTLLTVPWTARRSNQSILKEIIPEYSWEGLMLKLKLQYFSHLMQKADSLEKILMLEKIEGRKRSEQDRMRWLDGITDSKTLVWSKSGRWWKTGKPGVLQSLRLQSQTRPSDWTRTITWGLWSQTIFSQISVFLFIDCDIWGQFIQFLCPCLLICKLGLHICFSGGGGWGIFCFPE